MADAKSGMASGAAPARRVTLLQLAIAASAAIVPVLMAVLLVVANARGGDGTAPARDSERHVSVRHLAALKTFEQAIVRRDRVRSALPEADVLLQRVPQCRAEWSGEGGTLARARRVLSRSSELGVTPVARMATQLAAIDEALLRFSSGDNRRVSERVGLDGARWLEAVAATLQQPISAPEYPGRRFAVQCGDITAAITSLARADGRMLAALAWRGTEVDRVLARWRPEQFVEISSRQVARTNPWAGIPGCVYLARSTDAGTAYYVANRRGIVERLCPRADMLGLAADASAPRTVQVTGEPASDTPLTDPRWKVPPSLGIMLQPLETLHRPGGSLYRAYTATSGEAEAIPASYSYGPNRVQLAGNAVDVGFSIDLTIVPELQALAQQTAACYTGSAEVCSALGMRRAEDGARGIGARMLEHAMVRMAAVAVIDVASGRIEALAGAMSPCTRQEYDGPGRSVRCDRRLPYPIRYRPDALLNPAVFLDAMPASTIKPIMAAAFLSDPLVGPRWLAAEKAEMARAPGAIPLAHSMRAELMRSDSARFLDRMFCADKGFAPCPRPWEVQQMARAFGWNGGCAQPAEDCGKRDVLFGSSADDARVPVRTLAFDIEFGRLLVEPAGGRLGAPFHLRPPTSVDPEKVRRCASGPDGRRATRDDWEKCGGGVIVDIVAEGWGQGHARTTAVGSAGMMATLAAAANGQAQLRKPHLVESIRGAGPASTSRVNASLVRASVEAADANPVARDAAEVILSGLSFGHRAGTSRLACEQVFDARTCAKIDWIAGKTGTPTFPNDDRTLDELAKLCAAGVPKSKADRAACGPLRPYKWYVAAYRTDPADPRWTKVVAVLCERNWFADSARVHGAGDHGPNPAAEIAMQIVGRHVGALPWSGS